jgi:hypothetical protein
VCVLLRRCAVLTTWYVSLVAGGTRASYGGSDGIYCSRSQARAGQSICGHTTSAWIFWFEVVGDGVTTRLPAYYEILKIQFPFLLSICFGKCLDISMAQNESPLISVRSPFGTSEG